MHTLTRREISLGAYLLGRNLERDGDLEGAEDAYRRADARGDAAAARRFGLLLEQRGDLDDAERAYRRAHERGDGVGTALLGELIMRWEDRDLGAARPPLT